MGTRHLTVVMLDGKHRVAQYGQWDGYPECTGGIVLDFLKKMNRSKFEAALRACSFLSKMEMSALEEDWKREYPQLSRDVGAEILGMIQELGGLKLKDTIDFVKDSLFCEYAYVIDLDNDRLEVYEGFQKSPLPESERFYGDGKPNEDGYFPVKLGKAYPLNKLPSIERLVKDFTPKDSAD